MILWLYFWIYNFVVCFSVVELEKLYHIALNGSEEEKSAAAKILCGASLVCGWNIQVEHLHTVVNEMWPSKLN